MAVATDVKPDVVIELSLEPGGYRAFVDAIAERTRPLLKCYQGSVTLVSPGRSHETMGRRLGALILAVCSELGIRLLPLGATLWDLPEGACAGMDYENDTGYEADEAYYIQNFERADDEPSPMPDLAVEVVVSRSAHKALCAGAALGIPELWVLDVGREELTFHGLARKGKNAGSYVPMTRSRALPMLTTRAVLERLADPEKDSGAFLDQCRQWARDVLAGRNHDAGRKGRKTE
jgi:Uma2 family endonuclease